MSSQDFTWIAIGVASLIVAAGILIACLRLAAVLGHADRSLDGVDKQLASAEPSLAKTLEHVSGVAKSLDGILGRVEHVMRAAEKTVGAVAKSADAAQAAASPTIANLVAVVAGVSEGARTFFRARGQNGDRSQSDRTSG